MTRRLLISAAVLAGGLLSGLSASGAEVGPIYFGFHLIPNVEASDGGRAWDLSLSLGLGVESDDSNRVEIHALTDSHLTTLGATVLYEGGLSDRLSVGAGLTVLWPFDTAQRLLRPLVEGFAHATFRPTVGTPVRGELSLSLPVVSAVQRVDGWDLVPLADLPSLSMAAAFDIAENGALQAQITLQPVIIDTTAFERPIGRVTDDLLIIPSFSRFALYGPPR